jgi:hypothetical protein
VPPVAKRAMRSLPESATAIVPPASIVSADGSSNWPGPFPGEPIERTGSPVARLKTTIRERRSSRT